MDNIFVVGSQVKGDSQIGYKRHILKLYNMMVAASNNNVSITGLPRFGKTSLAKTVIRKIRSDPNSKILPIFLDLAKYNNFGEVLEAIWLALEDSLATSSMSALLEHPVCKRVTQQIENSIKNNKLNHLGMSLEKWIDFLNRHDIKIILTLDEFDSASNIFSSVADFEYFRDLCTNSDLGVSLLLISRRPVHMIEKRNLAQSTFHGILSTYSINGFNNDDMKLYYAVLEERYNINLDPDEKELLVHFCGQSPYLLSIIGHELVELNRAGESIDIGRAYQNNELDFRNYFNSIVSSLSGDALIDSITGATGLSTMDKLMGFLVGPKVDLTEMDKSILMGMDYLFTHGDRYYAISSCFSDYLMQLPKSSSLFNSLMGLQKKVFAMIRKQVMANLGIDYIVYDIWQEIFENAGVADRLETYDGFVKTTMKTRNVSVDLLDVCSLEAACKILGCYWERWFSAFFNNDSWDKWRFKFELCAKARDPLAHGHEEFLSNEEKIVVECYCKEILKILANSTACLDKDVELTLAKSIACRQARDTYFRYRRENTYDKLHDKLKGKEVNVMAAHQTKDGIEGFFECEGAYYPCTIKKKKWDEWIPGASLSEHLGKEFNLRIISVDSKNGSLQFELI